MTRSNIKPRGIRRGIDRAALIVALVGPAVASGATLTDGFGDADRNNNGAITVYDTDEDLSGAIDGSEITAATDASDTGFIWTITRGFTGANDGDPKPNAKVIDDSTGFGSGLALAAESKGTGSSMAGFFGQPFTLGPVVGAKVVIELGFRIDSMSTNPTPPPFNGELRWGLFQNTDNQFGQTANVGLANAPVVWGPDTGENDGLWRDSNPGPRGDKGVWARIPIGAGSDPLATRINFENNTGNYMEGSDVGGGGDVDTVASPGSDGPGGRIGGDLATDPMNQVPLAPHTLRLEIIRTATGIDAASFIDGVQVLRDEIDGTTALGAAPESFDYVALRNATGDWDYIIDNVSVRTVVPEPASLALLTAGVLLADVARRRKRLA